MFDLLPQYRDTVTRKCERSKKRVDNVDSTWVYIRTKNAKMWNTEKEMKMRKNNMKRDRR